MSLSNGRKAKRTGLKLLVCLNIYLFVCTTIYECSMSYKYVFSVTLSKLIPVHIIWDTLPDLVPCVQFEKLEKRPWGSVNFISFTGKPATFLKGSSSMDVFQVFKIVQMVPNGAKQHIFFIPVLLRKIFTESIRPTGSH